jgi:hypothetical protein
MSEIPIINQVPEKYRGYALIAIWAFPYVTRAWQSISAGNGIVGALRGILFGTNQPKMVEKPTLGKDLETGK